MEGKMKAAVFKGEGVLAIEEVDIPVIEKGDDIIVKVELCSICGTDVHIMSVPPGYVAKPNTILGHELVGRVVAIGDSVKTIKVGDRVVTNPNDYCGVCVFCKKNLPNFCQNIQAMGIDVDGGFAEYVKITEKVAFKISDEVSPTIAAFAEPLACFLNGMQKIDIKPGASVLICGAGAIGLMALQIVKSAGAYPVIVSEPVENRRLMAKQTGADIVVNPLEEDLGKIVAEQTGIGVDFALDLAGSLLQTCLDNVRKGGTVLLFGVNAKARTELSQAEITMGEKKVLGTWIANATFPLAVKLLESGIIDFSPLVTHSYPLESTLEGINMLRSGVGIEVMVDPTI